MRLDHYRQTTLKQYPLPFGTYKKMNPIEETADVMSLAERIRVVIREMPGPDRGKQTRLAKIADESKQTVNHWLTGHVKEIQYEAARRISEHFGFRVDWIMLGKGPIHKDDKEDPGTSAGEAMSLVYLTAQELEIITNFRTTDEIGRAVIYAASAQAKKV